MTVDLPEDLVLQVREYAARENRTLKSIYTDLLRRGLMADPVEPKARRRVKLALIESSRRLSPGDGPTPEDIKNILLEEDIKHYFESIGQPPPDPPYD